MTEIRSALVWGACGFIGRHLVGELCRRGGNVSVLTRARHHYPTPWWHDRVRWFELAGDVGDALVLERAVSDASTIFSLAGSTGAANSNQAPLSSLDQNNRAVLELLEACRRAGTRPHVVFTSSRLVYGRPHTLPVDESHPLAPASMYAAHKVCCEYYHQIYGDAGALTWTVARISNTYGGDGQEASKPHGIINAFVRMSLDGRAITLFGEGTQLRDYIYIDDLADVLIACGATPGARNQTFNVGSGTGVSLVDVAQRITTICGGPPLRFAPWPPVLAQVETGDYINDISKLRRLVPVSIRWTVDAGIAETIGASRRQQVP